MLKHLFKCSHNLLRYHDAQKRVIMTGLVHFLHPESKVRLQAALKELYHKRSRKFYQVLRTGAASLAIRDHMDACWNEKNPQSDVTSPRDGEPREEVEMTVPGLQELLTKARVNKSLWLAIREWCVSNGAVELEDIRVNLGILEVAAEFPKCVASRIRRHAEWPAP